MEIWLSLIDDFILCSSEIVRLIDLWRMGVRII